LHTSSKFGGNRLLKGTEDLSVEVKRKDRVDNLDRVLFEDHVVREVLWLSGIKFGTLNLEFSVFGGEFENFITLLGDLGGGERNEGTNGWSGGDEGNELGVEEFDGVSFSGQIGVEEFLGDGESLLGVGVLSSFEGLADWVRTTLEVGDSLLSDEDHVSFNAGSLELLVASFSLFDHEGVVTSTKTTVTGDDAEGNLLDFTLGEERKIGGIRSNTADKSSED